MSGGFLVILSRRYTASKFALYVLAGFLVLTGVLWAASIFTFVFCVAAAAAAFGAALLPSQVARNAITQVTGIQLCIENVTDLDYMFTGGFMRDGTYHVSDTGNIADQIGGAYYIWGTLIAALTFAILIGAYVLSNPARSLRRR